jgi:large subunit ribosomal protein L9
MKIILKKDVKVLGFKNDLLNVKPGFARNYLIPRGIALIARSKKEEFLKRIYQVKKEKLAKFFKKRGFTIESIKIIKTYKAIVRLHREVEVKISHET